MAAIRALVPPRLYVYSYDDYYLSLAVILLILIPGYVYSFTDYTICGDYNSYFNWGAFYIMITLYLTIVPIAIVVLWFAIVRCREIEIYISEGRNNAEDAIENHGRSLDNNQYGTMPLLMSAVGIPVGGIRNVLTKDNYNDEKALEDLFYQKYCFWFSGIIQLVFAIWALIELIFSCHKWRGTHLYIWMIFALIVSLGDAYVSIFQQSWQFDTEPVLYWDQLIYKIKLAKPTIDTKNHFSDASKEFWQFKRNRDCMC